MLDIKYTDDLPSQYGVYIFYDFETPIYIGKASNLKARVKSHFANASRDAKENLIIKNSTRIETIATISDFRALLMEAELIKKYEPKYNIDWKDDKSYLYIKITVKDKYPKIFLVRREDDKKSKYFGPFGSTRTARELLSEIRRVIPFCTLARISSRSCFYSKIGLCNPCPNIIVKTNNNELKKIYRQNIQRVINILSGKSRLVMNGLKKELKSEAIAENYEEALSIRNKIKRLNELIFYRSFRSRRLEDSIFKDDFSEKVIDFLSQNNLLTKGNLSPFFRVECFDVSNLFGKDATASMVVFENGKPEKSQYRRFKIKTVKKISDTLMLEEVFRRRFKRSGWRQPDLVVVDGGRPQLRAVGRILQEQSTKIPLIGIAKDPDRLIAGTVSLTRLRIDNRSEVMNFFRHIRDESHRFAKKYHLFLRKTKMNLPR